jgi:Uma2 family endonuclease
MATVSFSTAGSSPVELPLRQFDADEFIAMADAGVFDNRKRVELVGGYVVDMSPASPEHNYVVMRLHELFVPLIGPFKLWIQGALAVDRRHVFDPDFMLLKLRAQSYRDALPAPSDVALLVEVSGSSRGRDADAKLPIYAQFGIPEYWIAHLDKEELVVHRDPLNGAYREIERFGGESTVTATAAPEFAIRVTDIFR